MIPTGLLVLIAFALALVLFSVALVVIAKIHTVKPAPFVAPVRRSTSAPVPALPGR